MGIRGRGKESRVEDKARETENGSEEERERERGRERVVKSYQKLFGIPEPRDGAFVSLT